MIIKPDAVKRQDMGYILSRIKSAGFKVRRLEMRRLSVDKAKEFYKVCEIVPASYLVRFN